MTLQVALVGTDGIVLASDKKTVLRGNGLVDRSSLTSKILGGSAHGIAIAHSGNEFSEAVAQRILSDASPLRQRLSGTALESFASEVWKQDAWQSLDRRGELIIVSTDDLSRTLHVGLGPLVIADRIAGARAKRTEVDDKVYAGHASNPAIFFSERYYDKKPIADLLFLAAHVVLSGRRWGLIDGLEVVKCTSNGFERISASLIAELTERSDSLNDRIRTEIFASPSNPHRDS